VEHYQKALAVHEDVGGRAAVASVTESIALIHHDMGEHSRALEHYRTALAMTEEIGARHSLPEILGNIGNVYRDLGDYLQALKQIESALAVAEEIGNRRQVAGCTGSIGLVHYSLGMYAEALEHYRAAHALADELGDRESVALWLGNIGRLHATEGFDRYDAHEAEVFILRAIDTATECNAKPRLLQCYQWLAELYQRQGKWESAHAYTTRYYELDRELQSIEAHKQIARFEHGRQLAELEKRRAIEQAEADMRTQKLEAEKEIQRMKAEQTERELGNTTLQLLAQTELLSDLRSDLLKITRKIPPTEPAARELRERVRNLPCQSVDWDRFDRQFQSVHPDFIKRLTERAPDLTVTEVRICTMLRMNLKSVEMAKIFCITESGVEFHRKHIRKKLKLGREEKLPIVLGGM
jgi:tetratricopeptide (TPR) repeat protein/DNA-binding CsgD family transcriptional regulator